MYEKAFNEYAEAQKIGEEKMAQQDTERELWVLKPIDNFPKPFDESALEQVGGIVVKGNMQMMTFPYFLRQLTRKQGANYPIAAETLLAICSQVGMPREATARIIEELEQVLAVENNEVLC